MNKYFVFIEGLNEPEPQIWHDMPMDGNGKSSRNPIFKYKLTDEECLLVERGFLTLDNLAFRFKHRVNTA